MTCAPSPAAPRDAGVGLAAAAARGAAKWLGLAATPTFAAMALLASGKPMEMLCSAGPSSAFGGMVPMYLLMSAFHAPAWLRLRSGRA